MSKNKHEGGQHRSWNSRGEVDSLPSPNENSKHKLEKEGHIDISPRPPEKDKLRTSFDSRLPSIDQTQRKQLHCPIPLRNNIPSVRTSWENYA